MKPGDADYFLGTLTLVALLIAWLGLMASGILFLLAKAEYWHALSQVMSH